MIGMAGNVLLLTDSYKISHWKQYPPGTEFLYTYFESRGGRFPDLVFFGLQYTLKTYLRGAVVTRDRIEEADAFCRDHFGSATLFNRRGWEHILEHHGGRLPLRIKAVPEGTVVPVWNVLMTVENTDPACYWLPTYVETLLVQSWYGSTVATLSREIKRLIAGFLERTGDPSLLPFKLHDFGFRGVSSVESAGIGGAAHLVNFLGTDTIAGVLFAREHYAADGMPGFSIPAAEHSTMTAWGRESEAAAYANMLNQFPTGLVAVVSDSYNVYEACRDIWGGILRDRVLSRDGTLVIRPDSGDPPRVIVDLLRILGERFGTTINDKGFKVLDPHVRLIQGDGVELDSIARILGAVEEDGWSADNVVFGMGGALLQKVHRDLMSFALKGSAIRVNGVDRDLYKDPVTDPNKRSKPGRLKLVRDDRGVLTTVPAGDPRRDELVTVFEDGELLVDQRFSDVRARAAL